MQQPIRSAQTPVLYYKTHDLGCISSLVSGPDCPIMLQCRLFGEDSLVSEGILTSSGVHRGAACGGRSAGGQNA